MKLPSEKEFKVNEYITLKLEEGKTNIYVKGQLFNQCKFLLLNIPVDKISSFDEIDSIDEAAEKMEKRPHQNFEIPSETEFWGHCSNLQVWAEHDYDTRLLHRNIAFPLLKRLSDIGDVIARRVFKEEIIKRLLTGTKSVLIFLKDYLQYIPRENLIELFDDSQFYSLIYDSVENSEDKSDFGYSFLSTFAQLGVPKARKLLKLKIEEAVKTENHNNILYLRPFFSHILKRDLNVIFTCESFLSNIYISFQDIKMARSYVFPLLTTLVELEVRNSKDILTELIKTILKEKNLKYFALLTTYFRENNFDLIPIEDLHNFFLAKDGTVRKDLIEKAEDLTFVYPLLHVSAEKGDIQSTTILSTFLREIVKSGLDDYMISHLNKNRQYLKYIIPEWEVSALNWLEQKLPGKLKLVERFFYDVRNKKREREETIPDWWRNPFQFYIENNHVEGIALMDVNHCDSCLQSKDMYLEYGEIEPGNSDCCRGCGLYKIPNDIVLFEELKQLFIYANSFFSNEYISPWLGSLKSLEVLFLYACGSENLGAVLPRFLSLKILVMNESHIRTLPDTIGVLKNLEHLDLEWTHIHTLPNSIGNLSSLKRLILDNNPISRLPDTMKNLTNLHTLSLVNTSSYYNFELTEFPEVICSITSLKNLYLERNRIKSLPDCIGQLKNLRILSLNKTQIDQLPHSIGNLTLLESLLIEDCKLNSLPESIINLEYLINLNIKGNILSNLSDKVVQFLLDLEVIPENDLIYLRVNKSQAKILNEIERRTGSKLSLVPKIQSRQLVFFSSRTPDQFSVEENKVVGLRVSTSKNIEDLISKITTLKVLDLKSPFDTIPSSFKNLKDLEILRLNSCSIKTISNLEVFLKLKELDLSSNQISEIEGLDNLINLEILNLEYNSIVEIKGLDNLINLKELALDFNKINEIKGLENLINLWNLRLGINDIPKNLIKSISEHEMIEGYKFVNYCQDKIIDQQKLSNQFVMYQNKRFYVWNGSLLLKGEGITDINQIKGFRDISDIQILDLGSNEISEIKNLDHLTTLKKLSFQSNKITKIE
ncbi:MAG: leucine-rich repeat domain-containing protein [Candidatus Helarchaeota archaeon]|nr:leucine-rich repeat domain-containing protein [Candidatus Helarchaeota archaeon]